MFLLTFSFCHFQQKAQSVKDALEILVGRDQLEGVTCSRTNQEIEAWQQVTLEELPLVLLLHLKWFDYKLDGASKIVKCVEFPIDLKVDPSKYSNLWSGAGPLLLCRGLKQHDTWRVVSNSVDVNSFPPY